MQCLTNLVGLKSKCGTASNQFYLDDIEGLGEAQLAQLASGNTQTGAALAESIIDSAARLMAADVASLIPTRYRLNGTLNQSCEAGNFTSFGVQAGTQGTGIRIKNTAISSFSEMVIESLKVRTTTTGDYVLKLRAEDELREIAFHADALVDTFIKGINFSTSKKYVDVIFDDPAIGLAAVDVANSPGCGCAGSAGLQKNAPAVAGLQNGSETTAPYGFVPCVSIRCGNDALLCKLTAEAPRAFGLALLYLCAAKIFEENVISQRLNRTASFDKGEKKDQSEFYYSLYRERLTGNTAARVSGVASIISASLENTRDACVTCDSPVNVAWAIG
jgi:hypothetical protein